MKENKNELRNRWLCYLSGMVILALGIVLNTKSNLGVSPIISVAYSVSVIFDLNFGNATFVWYVLFVLFEMAVHGIRKDKKNLVLDALQIVVSLIFTRFMNLFSGLIPMLTDLSEKEFLGSFFGRLVVLILAIILTGIGAAMSLNAGLVPNPGDGIVRTLSELIHKPVGTTKNIWDISCVTLTCVLSLLLIHRIVGVGIGTVLAMLFVGRVVAVYNKLFPKRF